MCGIAGGWYRTELGRTLQDRLSESLKILHHRGPDDSGQELVEVRGSAAPVHLGTVRLAILDLSPAGHMPMSSGDDRFVVSYNGEITNYVEIRQELTALGCTFRSETDTEVLIQAWAVWGPSALDRFEGMYAFALVDRDAGTLTLARDAFGIKPLFYAHDENGLVFASELAGLLALRPGPHQLDWKAAVDYLQWTAYDHSARTFVAGVDQLQPGHHITLDLRSGQLGVPQRYWWPSVDSTSGDTRDEAAERVRTLFLDSLAHNLRSDVPVGVALSGGIDSSAIACGVRHLEPDFELNTFSYISPGERSERKWVDLVANGVGARSHLVEASGDDMVRDLDDMILAQGEPFRSTSIYAQYRVFEAAREAGIIVTLDGQGADEIFSGYDGYPSYRVKSLIESGQWSRASRFVKAWGEWPDRDPISVRASTIAMFASNPVTRWATGLRQPKSPLLDYGRLAERGVDPSFPRLDESTSFGGRLKGHLRSEITQRGLPALLRHGDRNSMHFSIESRVPFLDRALVEYTLSLDESQLVGDDGATKDVLRRSLRGIVPDSILDRRDKIGFETPESDWLGDVNAAISRDERSRGRDIGFLTTAALDSSTLPGREFGAGGQWRLLNLRRWVDLLGIDAS